MISKSPLHLKNESQNSYSDEEYLDQMSNNEIIASIFRGILRYTPIKETKDDNKYKEELKSKLKFKHINDPRLLRSCIDLLEDTQHAITDFFTHGLGTNNRIG